jgi:UPF0716 protein FxsA
MFIFLVFVVTPLIELAILIYLGTLIGALYTILIVMITGFLGAFLARRQGLATLSRIRNSVEQGVLPSSDLFQAVLILIGGLLLLTPGLITDLAGFTLLVPQTRNVVTRWLQNLIQRKIERKETLYWRIR